jgi:hypothetical protein
MIPESDYRSTIRSILDEDDIFEWAWDEVTDLRCEAAVEYALKYDVD